MVGIAKVKWAGLDSETAHAREYTAIYVIEDVPRNSTGTSIRLASGLPQLGDSYIHGTDGDLWATAYKYSGIRPIDWQASREVWAANVHYTTSPDKQRQPAQSHDNPLLKPPIISGGGHRRRVAAFEVRMLDQVGTAILNMAGGYFPAAEVQVDASSNVLRITKNYASLDLDTLDDYVDSVNSTPWMGKPIRTWKMDPATYRLVYYGNTAYYEVSYSFQGNPETWDLKPRNLGERDINGDPLEIGTVLQSGFHPLDQNGLFQIPLPGVPPVLFDGLGPNPAPLRYYKEKDFTALGLPSSLP